MLRYRASKGDCDACALKERCCPKEPSRGSPVNFRTIPRSARAIAQTVDYAISWNLRKKVEMLFAHLKRILGSSRLRLRGPNGARGTNSTSRPPHKTSEASAKSSLPISKAAC